MKKEKQLEKWYEEELARRDKEIDHLKEQNTILMKSALNSAKKISELTEMLKQKG